MISQKELQEILHYDIMTGIFTWKVQTNRRIKLNDQAGAITTTGYVRIRIKGRAYRAHRLAWFYVTGEWPPEDVDHIDGDKTNNAMENLRLCDRSENMANTRLRKDSRSGVKGVRFNVKTNKWKARVRWKGKEYKASFNSLVEAEEWIVYKRQEVHKEFANNG